MPFICHFLTALCGLVKNNDVILDFMNFCPAVSPSRPWGNTPVMTWMLPLGIGCGSVAGFPFCLSSLVSSIAASWMSGPGRKTNCLSVAQAVVSLWWLVSVFSYTFQPQWRVLPIVLHLPLLVAKKFNFCRYYLFYKCQCSAGDPTLCPLCCCDVWSVCLCFLQRSHSHVWDHEELRSHLREALVARPLQNRLPHLWQHEAPWAADRGQRSLAADHQIPWLFMFSPLNRGTEDLSVIYVRVQNEKGGIIKNVTCIMFVPCLLPENRVDDDNM